MALWDMSCTGYTSKVTTTDMYNEAYFHTLSFDFSDPPFDFSDPPL